MLILMTALLVAQQATVESQQKEIVVVGQRLSHWTGKYAIRGSKLRCITKTSSGDRDIDALGCGAFDACADQLASRIAATDEKTLPKEVRVSMKESVERDLSICVAEKRVVLIRELAKHRQGIRGSTPS
jgi:hypothetical protein